MSRVSKPASASAPNARPSRHPHAPRSSVVCGQMETSIISATPPFQTPNPSSCSIAPSSDPFQL
jgi:hypothetical protein